MGNGERNLSLLLSLGGVGALLATAVLGGKLVFEHAAGIPTRGAARARCTSGRRGTTTTAGRGKRRRSITTMTAPSTDVDSAAPRRRTHPPAGHSAAQGLIMRVTRAAGAVPGCWPASPRPPGRRSPRCPRPRWWRSASRRWRRRSSGRGDADRIRFPPGGSSCATASSRATGSTPPPAAEQAAAPRHPHGQGPRLGRPRPAGLYAAHRGDGLPAAGRPVATAARARARGAEGSPGRGEGSHGAGQA